MDPRIPEFHLAVVRMVADRVANLGKVATLLDAPTHELTDDAVKAAIRILESELPSPLRATLFDLGRILAGTLPTEDIPSPPPVPLKIYAPDEG